MFRAVDAEEFSHGTSPNSDTDNSPRDELQSIENSNTPKLQSREITLKMILKELFFCIALAATTYSALHHSQTKFSKHPNAVRFFDKNSPVEDWYKGDLSKALNKVNLADVAFVMYYAPWDAESQFVRQEFEKVAEILGNRVHFSAVNCWNPGSECRTYSKLSSWPIIMAYTITSKGIIYKGPKDSQSMINFLELLMKPLKSVSNTEDLVYLLSICDAVAVGFTPLTDHSRDYTVWYNTAVKALEFDILGEICFASVTSEDLAADLAVHKVPTARLMLWNDTKEFSGTWNTSALVSWVVNQYSPAAWRILPLWRKAGSFARFADGPLLLLFTPMNPLYRQLPNYALLREVAMEYYNCNNNDSNHWITELIKLQQAQRLLYQRQDYKKFCNEFQYKKPRQETLVNKVGVTSQYTKYSYNITAAQRVQRNNHFNFFLRRQPSISNSIDGSDDVMAHPGFIEECSNPLFPAEKDFYNIYDKCETLEEKFRIEELLLRREMQTSMLPLKDDELAPENLVQDEVKHYCNVMNFAYSVSPPVSPSSDDGNVTSVEGLACATNISLHIVAVDSIRNYHFAESLGIDIKKKKNMTSVVILDTKQETQHVLSSDYSAASLRRFIANFTRGSLSRMLRTQIDATHTHYFTSGGVSDIDILDLNTHSFRKIANTRGKVTLIVVCGGACPAHTTRSLAAAARLLQSCGVPAAVGRIDGLRHDLPWEYTSQYYPTVLVFPPDRRGDAESLLAARGSRLSASAATAAALRALPPPLRLRVRLDLCARTEARDEKRSCLRDVKLHVTSVINRNLQYWRWAKDLSIKQILYTRLQDLHQVHFDLQLLDVSDLHNSSSKKRNLFTAIGILASNWQGDSRIFKRKYSGQTIMKS